MVLELLPLTLLWEASKIVHGPDETISEYERRFTLWLQPLQLYRKFVRYQDSEVTMWFVAGLLARYQLFWSQEHVDLKQFHSQHRLDETEPLLPLGLQRFNLCERLRLSISDASTRRPSPSTPRGGHVSSIDNDPSPSHPAYLTIADANVAALHHRHLQGGRPAVPSTGRPPNGRSHSPRSSGTRGSFTIGQPAPCVFAPCAGRSHPPNV